MKKEHVTGNLQTLRELHDTGQINAIELEAARMAVFRQAMERDPDASGTRGEKRLDIPGL